MPRTRSTSRKNEREESIQESIPDPDTQATERDQSADNNNFNSFNPNVNTSNQISLFIQNFIKDYNELYDYELFTVCQEEFTNWTIHNFRLSHIRVLTNFRKFLRERGIYSEIKPHPAEALVSTFAGDGSADWNEQRFLELAPYGAGTKSPRIQRKFPQYFQGRTLTTELNTPERNTLPAPAPSTTPKMTPKPVNTVPAPAHVPGQIPILAQIPVPQDQQQIYFQPPYSYEDERRTTSAIIQLAKIYTDELKYSGSDDAFDWKYQIFQDYCLRVGMPNTDYAYQTAFPTMLKGQALSTYYTNRRLWISQHVRPNDGIKAYFEGPEQQRSKQEEWSLITLQRTISNEKNTGKSIKECLEIMLQDL